MGEVPARSPDGPNWCRWFHSPVTSFGESLFKTNQFLKIAQEGVDNLKEGIIKVDKVAEEGIRKFDKAAEEGIRKFDKAAEEGIRKFDKVAEEGIRKFDILVLSGQVIAGATVAMASLSFSSFLLLRKIARK